MAQIINALSEISDQYDAVFCDLWGCVHNGIAPFDDAVAALRAFRAGGSAVILFSNAPRPWDSVAKQLDKMGLPRDTWDAIATSGDSTHAALFSGAIGQNVYFIGQDHDHSLLIPPPHTNNPIEIKLTDLEGATGILCCGPNDPHADLDIWRPQFLQAREKGLKLLCANPDIVVDRGEQREWCAGALAQLYTEMGGQSLYFGKPHPPIYDLGRQRLREIDAYTSDSRILCIGDGIITDAAGAMGEGLDCLFITGGLAARETKTDDQPQPEALETFLKDQQMECRYAIGKLR